MPDPDGPSHLVVEFLRDRDLACPACLHNLRAATADRCPECGTPLHLEVTGSVSGVFWWLASVLGLGIGMLIAGSVLLYLLEGVGQSNEGRRLLQLVKVGVVPASEVPPWGTIAWVTTLVSLLGIGLAYAITSRRMFGRMTPRIRVPIGLAFALIPLMVLGLLRFAIWF